MEVFCEPWLRQCALSFPPNQQRFADQPEIYQQFLVACNEFWRSSSQAGSSSSISEGSKSLHARMKDLLKDDPDLLAEFEEFMPLPKGTTNGSKNGESSKGSGDKK